MLWHIEANEVLLAALSLARPSEGNRQWAERLMDYAAFRQNIRDGLRNAGYGDVQVFMRGGAVNGRKYQQGSPFADATPAPPMPVRIGTIEVAPRTLTQFGIDQHVALLSELP